LFSPNTPGLRNLQKKNDLINLLSKVIEARNQFSGERKIPLLLKIAPDLTDQDKKDIADVIINDKKVKLYFNLIYIKLKIFLSAIDFSVKLMD